MFSAEYTLDVKSGVPQRLTRPRVNAQKHQTGHTQRPTFHSQTGLLGHEALTSRDRQWPIGKGLAPNPQYAPPCQGTQLVSALMPALSTRLSVMQRQTRFGYRLDLCS